MSQTWSHGLFGCFSDIGLCEYNSNYSINNSPPVNTQRVLLCSNGSYEHYYTCIIILPTQNNEFNNFLSVSIKVGVSDSFTYISTHLYLITSISVYCWASLQYFDYHY